MLTTSLLRSGTRFNPRTWNSFNWYVCLPFQLHPPHIKILTYLNVCQTWYNAVHKNTGTLSYCAVCLLFQCTN